MIRSCRAQVLGDVEATKQKSDDENKQLTIKKNEIMCALQLIDLLTNSVQTLTFLLHYFF